MRRPDPYEERARALCRAAGVDPDSRIERPGLRSMPAWCGYRDAARQEHLAQEAAATAAGIAATQPQKPEFQNSPLTVFGEHGEATLAQMRNCMSVGNVVAGVICADGHVGYAQPVGGVIAYEKQISISGVGFDIGCGNMEVRLDVPFATIADRVGRSSRTWPRPSRSESAAATRSASSMRCLTTMTLGANPICSRIARRRLRSSARSAPATTMSI
jgi:tRNA-splicing ligase RtcB (3'-phosphate/5'-hydroxy nucleic acid ligase)